MASERYDLTDTIGACGPFQVALTFAACSATVLSAWGMVFMSFGIYNPGWKCLDDNGIKDNMTRMNTQLMNASFSSTNVQTLVTGLTSSNATLNGNEYHDIPEWNLNCELKTSCHNLSYNPDSSTLVTEFDLSCDRAWIASFIISIQMSGVVFGAYLGGQIGDRFGRKVSMYGGVVVFFIGHFSAIFPIAWQMYAVSAFIFGTGIGVIVTCSFLYPLEFVTEWWRGILPSVPVWPMGGFAYGLTVFVLRHWRHAHIASAVVSVVVFLPAFWAPESVRWLTVTGKVEQAKRVVTRVLRMNDRPLTDLRIIDDIANKEKSQMGQHKYNYLDLFKSPSIRAYSVKFAFMWISLAISYYTILFGVKSLSGDFYTNLLISMLLEFPGPLLIAPTANRLGRRKASLSYFLLVIVLSIGVVILSLMDTDWGSLVIVALALICKTAIAGCWFMISIYSSELYPTVIRSLHYGFLTGIGFIGSVISPYLIVADANSLHVPFLIICILYLICFGLIWTLPETKGKALSDFTHDDEVIISEERVYLEEPVSTNEKV